MKGVEFFFDEKGEPRAMLIDIRKNWELWEEFRDLFLIDEGETPPPGFDEVKSDAAKKLREDNE